MNAVLKPLEQATQAGARASSQPPLLHVENLTLRRGRTAVLDRVSLTLHAGRTLALIGESWAGGPGP